MKYNLKWYRVVYLSEHETQFVDVKIVISAAVKTSLMKFKYI